MLRKRGWTAKAPSSLKHWTPRPRFQKAFMFLLTLSDAASCSPTHFFSSFFSSHSDWFDERRRRPFIPFPGQCHRRRCYISADSVFLGAACGLRCVLSRRTCSFNCTSSINAFSTRNKVAIITTNSSSTRLATSLLYRKLRRRACGGNLPPLTLLLDIKYERESRDATA